MISNRHLPNFLVCLCMSPVSPVFHTEVTVSIGLKKVLNKINCLTLLRLSVFLFGKTRLGEDRLPDWG